MQHTLRGGRCSCNQGSDKNFEESAGAAIRHGVCWTMVVRLISDDVERIGNVQWWSLVSAFQTSW